MRDFAAKPPLAAKPPSRPSLARAVLKPFYRTSAADLLPPAGIARSAGCEVSESDPFLVRYFS